MKIDIVDIAIEDLSKKAEIAYLVDQVDFKRELALLREKWHVDPQKFSDHPLYISNFVKKLERSRKKNLPTPCTEEHLVMDLKQLRKKFGRTIHFDLPLRWIFFKNVVPEGVYQRYIFKKMLVDNDNPEDSDAYQYVFIMTPTAQKKDFVDAYKKLRFYLWGGKNPSSEHQVLASMSTEELAYLDEIGALPSIPYTKYDLLNDQTITVGIDDDLDELIEYHSKGPLSKGESPILYSTPKELDLARRIFAIVNSDEYQKMHGNKLITKVIKEELEKYCPEHGKKDKDGHICNYCDPYLDSSKLTRIYKLFAKRLSSRF